MFNNLPASRPTSERRWGTWVLVIAAHILVVYLIVVLTARPEDQTFEVIQGIILEDDPPPMPPQQPVEPEPQPAGRGRGSSTQTSR
jgi:hypothetical protein